ncbi:MAG: MmgE/PrpD family protein [Desulfobacterales bacterium]|nr:MmgE/PrpD family protein [Deltaproteobacteria bacterium]NNK94343.1 MmgE/PrpD family protein [Desulfobacterales bacterium]
MNLTREIAQLCYEVQFENISDEIQDRVKYLLLDYLGVAIRGAKTESSIPVHRFCSVRQDVPGGVPVIATELRVDAPYAALAMGVAAHSLELDDVVNAASLHPAVSVMSAALAAGYLAKSSGQELIAAIVAGYEVTVKLGIALDPAAHYARGFHPTGTCGTLGAAVAAAKIFKLDPDGITHAMGIAGSQAAGSMEFLADGAYTKRFHAGWSAHSGLIAALLAKEGFTGPQSIIEGRFGFLHAYSGSSDPEKVLAGWGRPYEVMNTSIKPHACCRYKQGAIDCILQIVNDNELLPDDIERVQVSILKAGFALVAEPPDKKMNPSSVVDAQFSMPFGAAVAIVNGSAFLDQYSLENVSSPGIRELMPRVFCTEDPEIEKEFPQKWPAKVEITSKVGKKYFARLEYPKGDPENPLTWNEIISKFASLATTVFSRNVCSDIVTQVRGLENMTEVVELINQLKKP